MNKKTRVAIDEVKLDLIIKVLANAALALFVITSIVKG